MRTQSLAKFEPTDISIRGVKDRKRHRPCGHYDHLNRTSTVINTLLESDFHTQSYVMILPLKQIRCIHWYHLSGPEISNSWLLSRTLQCSRNVHTALRSLSLLTATTRHYVQLQDYMLVYFNVLTLIQTIAFWGNLTADRLQRDAITSRLLRFIPPTPRYFQRFRFDPTSLVKNRTVKPFITQFSPQPCDFISVRSKYHFQHPVLKTLNLWLPLHSEIRTHIKKQFAYFNIYAWRKR
jgi:hypothetical protein